MKLKAITNYLESIAPLAFQESYDNSGLVTGNDEMEITGVLIALDCTEAVIDEAIHLKCNLLVSHHPLLFSGIKKITGQSFVERVLIKAIKNNIALYSAHTNLDNIRKGVNTMICEKLELQNCKILVPKRNLLKKLIAFCPSNKAVEIRQALFSAGAGHIGKYDQCSFNVSGVGTYRGQDNSNPYIGEKGTLQETPEVSIEVIYPCILERKIIQALLAAHPYEEVAYDILSLDNHYDEVGSGMIGELKEEEEEMFFLKRVKNAMKTECIKHTALLAKKVRKVAVCGGSGSFLLKEAIAQQADVFISADFKYHQFFDAENKVLIADIGHYESEQFTKDLIYSLLSEKFPTFALHLSKNNSNPINYLY